MKILVLSVTFAVTSLFAYAVRPHVDGFPPTVTMRAQTASADTVHANPVPLMMMADTATAGDGSGSGSANAEPCKPTSTNPCIADPLKDPLQAARDANGLRKRLGILWCALAVFYVGARIFAAKNDEKHWINQPYAVAAIAGAPILAGAALDVAFDSGGSVMVLITALGAVAALFAAAHGKPKTGSAPSTLAPAPASA
jgi:hypothetical protein